MNLTLVSFKKQQIIIKNTSKSSCQSVIKYIRKTRKLLGQSNASMNES